MGESQESSCENLSTHRGSYLLEDPYQVRSELDPSYGKVSLIKLRQTEKHKLVVDVSNFSTQIRVDIVCKVVIADLR